MELDGSRDALSAHMRPVLAAEVVERDRSVADDERGVMPRHFRRINHDRAVGVAPDAILAVRQRDLVMAEND